METGRIKISDIVADEKFNARKSYDEEAITSLAKDIAKTGQINPLLVVPHATKPGKYFLISGFTRLKAMQRIEEETKEPQTAFVQITETADKLDQYVLNLGENIQRRELSYYDIASRVTEISQEFSLQPGAIGARVGLGGKHVGNYIRIMTKVRPDILEEWRKGHPKATTMNLAKLAAMDHDEQLQTWDEMTGNVAPETDTGDDEGGEEGAGGGDGENKKRRPSEAVLAAAIVAVQESDLDDTEKRGVLKGLRFAAGKAKTIPGAYNPAKKVKKGEAEADA